MFYLLMILAAATRLFPHPPNVACIGALGLFAGCYLSGKRAFFIPLAALLLSDIAGHVLGISGMGFYHPVTMLAVYAGVALSVPVGRLLASRESLWIKAPAGSLIASTAFFVVSNFGVWISGWYTLSIGGLIACYVNAIPFYGYTIVGDLAFTGLLFGSYEFSRKWSTAKVMTAQTA